MNWLAWVLATDSEERFRNGAEAVKWATRACEEDGWKTASYIDTLAAAYAEAGRWKKAVATQREAISKLTGEEAEEDPSYESRLQKYLRRERVRE